MSLKLAAKPSGCVIWMHFDPEKMDLGPFRWLGGAPGAPLPTIAALKVAKHAKANAQGIKLPRLGHREVNRSAFEPVATLDALVARLFGVFPTTTLTA